MVDPRTPLLEVRNLHTEFPIGSQLRRRNVVQAVNDVSFDLQRGETLGLVGESGSGKSTLARTIIGLDHPVSGSIKLDGAELVGASAKARRETVRRMQMVFQDPIASLNPRLTAEDSVSEAWRVNPGTVKRGQWHNRAVELLERVGLNPDHAKRYPHQFSGGQRQRIGIARALALDPELIICDEAVSALDVSVQAQILNLLTDLRRDFNLTYLFIAHDLSVVRHLSDQTLVMYLGAVMETGESESVFTSPRHPYTRALLSAVPAVRPWDGPPRERILLSGDLPSAINPPTGCPFRTRCWKATQLCADERPELAVADGTEQLLACHFPEPVAEAQEVSHT